MRSLSVALTVFVLTIFSTSLSLATERRKGSDLHEVVIATVRNPEAARRVMVRAGMALALPIATPDLSRIPRRPGTWGHVVAARRGALGTIVVSTFSGEGTRARAALTLAKKYFPDAADVPAPLSHARPEEASGESDFEDSPYYVAAGILVVASSPFYRVALQEAMRFSKASGASYESNGMVFDSKRGLIFPDDNGDEAFAGVYIPRRSGDSCADDRCVTVERSEFYDGFAPGLYIVVAGILRQAEVEEARTAARRFAPGAYVKPTLMYMGCRH